MLRKVRCYRYNRRFIFLTIEFEGNEYIGCLIMEFEFLGEYMGMLLEACLGMSIESIGSLEVPFTFEELQRPKICTHKSFSPEFSLSIFNAEVIGFRLGA